MAAHRGDHQRALECLEPWEARLRAAGLRSLLLQLLLAQAASEAALGRDGQATQRRQAAAAVREEIATTITDPDLLAAFVGATAHQ